ncbi:MAG: SpoVA/SpoVAEb family sporulation membrane protein [Bacilli bacterium]
MDKKDYQIIVDKFTPKEDRLKNGIISFFIGGIMGILGELMLNAYKYFLDIPSKEAGTYMIITLIFISCLLTCFGFFDKFVNFAKAGLFIPISGFAHAMMSAALEYRKEGIVTGLGANMFKLAGSVIIVGVVSAYVFGLIRILIFGGSV